MVNLGQYLAQQLLEAGESQQNVAIFPSKFKPPHKGHFEAVEKLLKKVDQVTVLISPKMRDGITAEEAVAVWDLYKQKLDGSVEVRIASSNSVKYVLDTIESNPNNHYIAVYGKGDEERYRNIGKDPRYMNAEVFNGGAISLGDENISATNLRKAMIDKDIQAIKSMLPDGVNAKEYIQTLAGQKKLQEAVTDTEVICDNCGWHWSIEDGGDDLYVCHKCGHDNTPKSNKTWNLQNGIVSLTKYMLDNGMNISPLPKLKFIDNDKENAGELLGKTAYYNPLEKSITLYTLNRHPKDILRSYAHEMVHHAQNLENRLDDVNTTDTNEDGALPDIEREAYEKGNMMLRNWEDKIKSEKYIKEYKEYALNELFEKDLPNIEKISKTSYIVGNGKDIEAEYYFRRIDIDNDIWAIGWSFTDNNQNTSPEAWKQVTATSFKVLNDFIKNKNPKQIEISGNTDSKTNIYKSPSFLEKLENIFNNQYLIKNDDESMVLMKSIEEAYKHAINESVKYGGEKYEDVLYYWQNLDVNSKSKIERWSAIKRKVKREVLQELYNL